MGYVVWFPTFDAVNHATMNIGVLIFFQISILCSSDKSGRCRVMRSFLFFFSFSVMPESCKCTLMVLSGQLFSVASSSVQSPPFSLNSDWRTWAWLGGHFARWLLNPIFKKEHPHHFPEWYHFAFPPQCTRVQFSSHFCCHLLFPIFFMWAIHHTMRWSLL